MKMICWNRNMKSYKFISNDLETNSPPVFNTLGIVLLTACFIMAGCSLIQLKKEVSESLESTILVGHISTPFPGRGPIIVAAYSKNKGKRKIAHYTVLHDVGEYELIVGKGKYFVFAVISGLLFGQNQRDFCRHFQRHKISVTMVISIFLIYPPESMNSLLKLKATSPLSKNTTSLPARKKFIKLLS